MARPRIEIDWEQFAELCKIQCTLEEISSVLGCSEDTIERAVKRKFKLHFADVWAQKAAGGKSSMRRTMWNRAMGGVRKYKDSKGVEQKEIIPPDNTMLIWLSKNYLNFSDKQENRPPVQPSGNVTIVWQTLPSDKKPEDFFDKPNAAG